MAWLMETEPNYCEKVQRVEVRPTDLTFHDKKFRQGSNYKQEKGKGCTLIINNMFGHLPDGPRRGAKVDLKNLKELWEKLGSEVWIKEDLTASDMKIVVGNFCVKCKSYDYCVIFIMSHGTSDNNGDIILGNDHKEVRVKDDIVRSCQISDEIPKILFFQCCRSTVSDEGTLAFNSVPSVQSLIYSSYLVDKTTEPLWVFPNSVTVLSNETLPDMLVSYATQSGNQAFRHSENGSWYVNAITNVFMNHAKDEHVADLMTKVHNAISSQTTTGDDQGAMEMPEVKSSLQKKLYLYPGINLQFLHILKEASSGHKKLTRTNSA